MALSVLLIAVLLESIFISYPLTLFVLILLSIFKKEDILFLGFAAGLVLDLLSLRLLGLDSLVFLLILFVKDRYKKKIHEGTFGYRFLYLCSSLLIYNFVYYKTLSASTVLITFILASISILLLNRVYKVTSKKQLEV